MTRAEFEARWRARQEDFRLLGVLVRGDSLIDDMLNDLDAIARAEGKELLNLTQASARCGYTADSLGRMVRDGRLANYGKRNAPMVRASDLPRKPLRPALPAFKLHPASRQSARIAPGGSQG